MTAGDGEPQSGRVWQGGQCSPRGRAAPSGRAPARGGGSCNSGGSAPSCGERAGPGGARAGLGPESETNAEATREWAGEGRLARGLRDEEASPIPFPYPIYCSCPGSGSSHPRLSSVCFHRQEIPGSTQVQGLTLAVGIQRQPLLQEEPSSSDDSASTSSLNTDL